ncbi:unnamed protein product [Lactuca saligna]|uniref:Nuclear cap-binding protein subunit 2 n=1 Tax=Lactuca saligna TaxID=75948 RepID=A0AA35YG55_LACSI|nr:unnamed protein product [Lactuca saligna]
MALLFKDPTKISAYRDRRFPGTQEEYEHALQTSTTVYIGNMSFYTTEEQLYELFSRAGEIKKIVMGLDKNTKTPCGFCFIMYYSREDTEDSVKYISGTILDDRPIRVDFDWGFQDGRQWGRGRSGGQPPPMAASYGRHGGGGGGHGYGGGGHRHGRGDYQRKRYRDDDRDRRGPDVPKRNSENETRRNSDFDSKQEKNPRFREHGDSDEEDDDRKRQK